MLEGKILEYNGFYHDDIVIIKSNKEGTILIRRVDPSGKRGV